MKRPSKIAQKYFKEISHKGDIFLDPDTQRQQHICDALAIDVFVSSDTVLSAP